ncbi:hypothetical protein [Pseudarthrobacter sp. YAF2]|uniref:hypothetical protein n=1 Tax=Pseudarthrobacter sp. YAF2 TaxID=3233078 RepID=UPI003F9CD78A
MDDSDGLVRKRAEARLRSVWSDIGFQTLSGDVMILDLNLVTFEDRLRTMRKKFGVD